MNAPIDILGVRFHPVTFEETVGLIERYIRERTPRQIVTGNADFVFRAHRNSSFMELMNTADLVVADGASIVIASHLLGTPVPERIAGLDLAIHCCELSRTTGYRIFLLGGAPTVCATAAERLTKRFPGIHLVGAYSPPFNATHAEEDEKIVSLIESARPDILFVCLGCEKQEFWIRAHLKRLGVPVSIGLGSFVDYAAGTFRRAPRFFRQIWLEWLFRLVQEPRRLWKRYLVDDVHFFAWVIVSRFKRRKR